MPALCSPHSCWSRVSVPSLKSSSSGSSTVPSHIFHLETLLHLYLLKQINYYGTERPNSWLNCWLILYRSEFTVQKPGAQIKTNNCQLIFRQQASQLISCSRSEFICCLQIFSFFIFKLIIQFFFFITVRYVKVGSWITQIRAEQEHMSVAETHEVSLELKHNNLMMWRCSVGCVEIVAAVIGLLWQLHTSSSFACLSYSFHKLPPVFSLRLQQTHNNFPLEEQLQKISNLHFFWSVRHLHFGYIAEQSPVRTVCLPWLSFSMTQWIRACKT